MRAAELYAWRGQYDEAFKLLNQLQPGAQNFDSPLLTRLHDDPQWQPLVERLGRSQEERDSIEFDVSLPTVN